MFKLNSLKITKNLTKFIIMCKRIKIKKELNFIAEYLYSNQLSKLI